MQTGTRFTPTALILSGLLVLAGVTSDARPSLAQAEEACPRPAGVAVNPLETPSVTAAQAAESAENLKAFALAGKRYLASIRSSPELVYSGCLTRHEGPWKSGSTYVVTISLDGRVFFHSGNMALSGRPLKPAVWEAIATATGAAALQTTGAFGNPDGGALPAQIGGGYAVGFKRTQGGATLIMTAGLDIGESHLAAESVDPGNPAVRADQVVDLATLRTFVNGAADHIIQLYRTEGRSAFAKAKSVLRNPNGPWRHGSVYLFIMEPTGYTIFHGAFPDKYEYQTPTTTLRDEVTGELILPQIIKAATEGGDGGGFVKYYFDDPDDDTDSATVPKVTYVVRRVFPLHRPDGSTSEYSLIFGAGVYGLEPDVVGRLENPGPASSQSGISALWGWACEAEFVDIEITTAQGEVVESAAEYGLERSDTLDTCGDTDNGFVLLFNWNRLGAGTHTVTALVDGLELDRATVQVTTLGEGEQQEFLRGVAGECVAENFPSMGQSTRLEWQQSQQNFVITDVQ